MKENLHESILLEGLAEGNTKVFDYLFHYYYSGLVVFSMKYVTDKAVAEDLVQDFFFKLWNKRNNLQINQTIKSYFFTSIKNRSLDYIKHTEVKTKAEDFLKSVGENFVEQEESFLVEAELKERIELAMNKLPDKCRFIFELNRFEGIKPSEIAKRENLSVRTVETHIGKALKILRKELEPYLPSYLLWILLVNLKDYIK